MTNDERAEVVAMITAALKVGHTVKIVLVGDDGRTVEGTRKPGGWAWRQDRDEQEHARQQSLASLMEDVTQLRKALESLRLEHYTCDDCWYSCPASGESLHQQADGACWCGADEHNARIDKALASG